MTRDEHSGGSSELEPPEKCPITWGRRVRKLHMAHGYTPLESGDRVTVFPAVIV